MINYRGEQWETFVGAYGGVSSLSKMIKFRGWSDVSHVSVIRNDDHVIEAWGNRPSGVRTYQHWSNGHTKGTKIRVYSIPDWSEIHHKSFWAYQEAQIGTKYDYWGILGFLIRAKLHCPEKWFCSELVQEASIHTGMPFLQKPSHQTHPGDVITSPRLKYLKTVVVGEE
jgi:hypothetical protein